MYKHKEQQKKF